VDLGADDLRPKLLAQRLAGGDLQPEPRDDLRVPAERQQHSGGQVVRPAENDSRAVMKQSQQRGVRIGRLGVLDEHEAEILARDRGAGRLVVSLVEKQKLIVLDGEVAGLLRDFDGAINHGR
jgi:hypothetical protein